MWGREKCRGLESKKEKLEAGRERERFKKGEREGGGSVRDMPTRKTEKCRGRRG